MLTSLSHYLYVLLLRGSTVLEMTLAASQLEFLHLFRHSVRSFGWVISPSQRPLTTQDNTTHTRTNIHALSGVEPTISASKRSKPSPQTARPLDRLYQWYSTGGTRRHLRGYVDYTICKNKGKAVPLHAMKALGGRGGVAPIHSRPRH
jgi:hypothetical protein